VYFWIVDGIIDCMDGNYGNFQANIMAHDQTLNMLKNQLKSVGIMWYDV